MTRLKEGSTQQERHHVPEGPTKIKTELNRYPLRCRECGDMYYVNECDYHDFKLAFGADPSELTFCCNDCEDAGAEEAYAH